MASSYCTVTEETKGSAVLGLGIVGGMSRLYPLAGALNLTMGEGGSPNYEGAVEACEKDQNPGSAGQCWVESIPNCPYRW